MIQDVVLSTNRANATYTNNLHSHIHRVISVESVHKAIFHKQ